MRRVPREGAGRVRRSARLRARPAVLLRARVVRDDILHFIAEAALHNLAAQMKSETRGQLRRKFLQVQVYLTHEETLFLCEIGHKVFCEMTEEFNKTIPCTLVHMFTSCPLGCECIGAPFWPSPFFERTTMAQRVLLLTPPSRMMLLSKSLSFLKPGLKSRKIRLFFSDDVTVPAAVGGGFFCGLPPPAKSQGHNQSGQTYKLCSEITARVSLLDRPLLQFARGLTQR